jgi:RsfA family transcription factor
MGVRGKTPEWDENQYERLAQLVLEMVSEGYTLRDAFRKFEEETNHVRTQSAIAYKWITKLSKKYAKEYEEAKLKGEQRRMEMASKQNRARRRSVMFDGGDGGPPVVTTGQLIKLLRNVQVVGDDEQELRAEVERLKGELEATRKERDSLQAEIERIRAELADVTQERDDLLRAFSIARRHIAGIERTSLRVSVGPDGTVQKVEAES